MSDESPAPLYTIRTAKEALKFSAAHLATFADGSVERLHGHNYQVEASLSGLLDTAGMVLDVGILKKWTRQICEELNETVLVALENPLLTVQEEGGQVVLRYGEKAYSLPREDCALLPIPNTTMEHLAYFIARRLAERLCREPEGGRMESLCVSVSETPGQSASWTLRLSSGRE
jgi:6-pyruvoyltetrahydropterin/6-carboxytetrahydropterin synthase